MKKLGFVFVFVLFLFMGFRIDIKAVGRNLDEHYLNDIFKTSKDTAGLSRTEYVKFIKDHLSWYTGHEYEDGTSAEPACYMAQGYTWGSSLSTIGRDNTHGTYNCGGFVTRTFRDALKFLKNRTGSIRLLDNTPMVGHGTAASDWISQAAAYYHPNGPDRVRTNGGFGLVGRYLEGLPGKPGLYLRNADGYKCDDSDLTGCINKVLESGIKQGDLILFVPELLNVGYIICDTHIGIYWGEDGENKFLHSTGDTGTGITPITSKYELGCDYSLVVLRWNDDEPEKHYCEEFGGKFYDDRGNVVSKSEYERACIIPSTYKLTIKKVDEAGEPIFTSAFRFELLDESGNSLGKGCDTGGGSNTCYLSDISPGNYILEESINNTKYNELVGCDGDACDGKIEGTFRVKIKIENKDGLVIIKNRKNELSCGEKVEECGIGNKACLLEVWKEEKQNGNNFNKILDFFHPECREDRTTCTETKYSDCLLNVSYSDGVTDRDWSCATVQSLDADKYYFCGVKFNLKASQSYKDQTDRIDKGVESGELYFNVTDGILIVGNASLTTTCYSSEDLDAPISSIKGTKIYDYIKVSLNGERLKGISSDPVEEKSEDGGIHKVVIEYKDIKFKYETEKIVKKITGQPCDDASENGCVGIGYGMLSKFGSNGTLDAEFKVDYDAINHRGTLSKSCRYKSTPKLITKKEDGDWRQNIEFRTISKAKPFTTKDGGTRDTKSNWCDKVADNCAFDNNVVKTYITDANDSYNSRSAEPEYTIILTPSDIMRIRDDMKNNPDLKYDDGSTLKYDDITDTWYSEYLNELENDGILKRGTGS